jgi:hypothetical protein
MRINFLSGQLIIVALICSFVIKAECQSDPELVFSDRSVVVKNLDAEILYTFCRYYNTDFAWRSVFPVCTKESGGKLSIDGEYKVLETSVIFTPRFPFLAGVEYVASFHQEDLSRNFNEVYLPSASRETLHLAFEVQTKDSTNPRVDAIYPSTGLIPDNLLKFHIEFNTAMKHGEVFSRVKLLDENNVEVEKPFLIVDQELWDDEMKTVTLLFDPGRIKRGLRPNLEMGPALQAGAKFTLLVEAGWQCANGMSTSQETRKEFVCTEADRQMPNTENWILTLPSSPDGQLTVKFDEPLDRVLLANALTVTDQEGKPVNGQFTFFENETSIRFKPENEWRDGPFTLHVNPLSEDLAGNNFNRLFDRDLQADAALKQAPACKIPFTVRTRRLAQSE